MNAFDKIIGYSSIKKELQQISDTLKNPEAYGSLGVSAPQGLLLYGEPGVGKSLMASAVIKDLSLIHIFSEQILNFNIAYHI